jgi:hypothetical protein
MNMREVLLRIVDGSRLDEFKPQYGVGLITTRAHIHGTLCLRNPNLRPFNWSYSEPNSRHIYQRISESCPIHPFMQSNFNPNPIHAQRNRIHGGKKDGT